jgi:hypothetical protein
LSVSYSRWTVAPATTALQSRAHAPSAGKRDMGR